MLMAQTDTDESTNDFQDSTLYEKNTEYKTDVIISFVEKESDSADVRNSALNLFGESKSEYVIFEVERFHKGIDLLGKQWEIHYDNGNNAGNNIPINVQYNEKYIRMGWIIPDTAVANVGNLNVMPFAYSDLGQDSQYIIKNKVAVFTVEDTLAISGGIVEPDNDWYERFYAQMAVYVNYAEASAKQASKAVEDVNKTVADVQKITEGLSSDVDELSQAVADAQDVINQIPTGMANEIIDARTGNDGTEYSSLGEAIRKQTENAETVAREEVAKIVAGAPEDFDTLKEMSDWIAEHGEDATAMNSAIQKNKQDIQQIQSDMDNFVTSEGDIAENTVSFVSGDIINPSSYTDIAPLKTREKIKSLLGKISTVVKNVRYLYKMLGSTDISKLGDGTVTSAINTLDNNINNLTAEDIGAFPGSILINGGSDLNNYKTPGVYYGNADTTNKNMPINASFCLIVLKSNIASYIKQIFITAQTEGYGGVYIREFLTNWSLWINIPTGIKGKRETTYRGGNVNLTPENIGAIPWYNSTIVGASTDWNTIVNPGSYLVQTGKDVLDGSNNAPANMYGYGILNVIIGKTDGGYNRIAQIYIPHGIRNNYCYAIRVIDASTWTSWRKMKDADANDATYVKKTGDKINGNLEVDGITTLKRSTGQGIYQGTHGTDGWVVIAQIKINATYVNKTLEFKVGGRYKPISTILSIMISSEDNNNPGLEGFYYYGGNGNIFRLKKTATSTYQLACQKGAAFGSIYIMLVHSQAEMEGAVEITYPNTQLATAPDSTWMAPTLAGEIGTAAVANSLSSSSSLKYKKNISEMTEEEARKLLELRPIKYDYIDEEKGTDCYGFVAEEVAEIMDYPVVYKDGEPDALDLSKFVPYQTKMIQVLAEEIRELRNVLNGLIHSDN